jgi:hypothetical protein
MLIVTPPEAAPRRCGGQVGGTDIRQCTEVCGTSDFEIGWGYVKQVEIAGLSAGIVRDCLGLSERPVSMREM